MQKNESRKMIATALFLSLSAMAMEKPKEPTFDQINSELRVQFPEMFAGIPTGYRQAIVQYALIKYKNLETAKKKFQELIKNGMYAIRIFNIEALAHFFGYQLTYAKGYLHYGDAPANFELTGVGYDFDIPTFKRLHINKENIQTRIKKNEEIYSDTLKLEKKGPLPTRWVRYQNLVLKELLLETDLLKIFDKKELAKPLYQKLAEFLVHTYKIHLMPMSEDFYKTAVIFFKNLRDNPTLRTLITSFKIRVEDNIIKQAGKPDIVMALFVIYPAVGKENAQQLLNMMYPLFNTEVHGSGQRPRWNARVNDLIWIAQGDGEYKNDEDKEYYEPNRIYYRADITGDKKNYHLVHPETGKELID
jgi:hypothetical protein